MRGSSVGGQGMLPLYLSSDWSMPLPGISRAIIVLHGRLRNADEYYISAHTAQGAAGDDGKSALMIVPQFLAEVDIEAYQAAGGHAALVAGGMGGWRCRAGAEPGLVIRGARCDPGKTLGPAGLPEFETGRGRRPFRRRPGRATLRHCRQGRGGAVAAAHRHPLCCGQSLVLCLFQRRAASAGDCRILRRLRQLEIRHGRAAALSCGLWRRPRSSSVMSSVT